MRTPTPEELADSLEEFAKNDHTVIVSPKFARECAKALRRADVPLPSVDALRTKAAHYAGMIPIDQSWHGSFGEVMECVENGNIGIQIAEKLAEFLDKTYPPSNSTRQS